MPNKKIDRHFPSYHHTIYTCLIEQDTLQVDVDAEWNSRPYSCVYTSNAVTAALTARIHIMFVMNVLLHSILNGMQHANYYKLLVQFLT